ncbi:Polyadenylate-binding protein [Pseudozyma hubeiensis]|nr:Polyadenylate-binding protein [Pseudozyma hubeiensis]
MPSFLSPTKPPAKFSDSNGRYTRIESGKIPSRGRSLASSRRGKYCLAVAAAAAAAAPAQEEEYSLQAASVVDNGSARKRKMKGPTLDEVASTAGRRSVAMIMDDSTATPSDGSTSAPSTSAALFTSHVQGIIALIGVIILLILVQFAHISVDNATYVRGSLNMLTGLAATASAHKLSMTVAVSSLASVKTTSSGSNKPPSAAVTVAAMGLSGGQAFNLIFGSDQFFQIVAFVEAICSAIASYMAGSSIVTSQTAVNKNGVPLLELDLSQAGTLWGICGLWIVALGLHAATAFANKSTIQTVQMASTESMREIVAVMHTESVYSGKQ